MKNILLFIVYCLFNLAHGEEVLCRRSLGGEPETVDNPINKTYSCDSPDSCEVYVNLCSELQSLGIIQIRISDYVNFYCSEIGQRVYIVTKEQYDNCEIPSEPTEMVGKCSDEFFINIPQYFSHEKVESSTRKLVQNGEIVYFTAFKEDVNHCLSGVKLAVRVGELDGTTSMPTKIPPGTATPKAEGVESSGAVLTVTMVTLLLSILSSVMVL